MENILSQKQKATMHVPKGLPFLIWALALVGIILWLYLLYYRMFTFKIAEDNLYKGLVWTRNIVWPLTYLVISASGIYILIKASYRRATLYFALLFTYLSAKYAVNWVYLEIFAPKLSPVFLVTDIIFFSILVRTLQEFPNRLTVRNIKAVFKHYPMKAFVPILIWFIPPYRTWLVFLALGLIAYGMLVGSMSITGVTIMNVVGLCFSLGYLFAQLRLHDTASKKTLYWLLWVVTLNLIYYFLLLSAQVFDIQITYVFRESSDVSLHLCLLIAFIMSVYFSDLVDAKLILQRTVIFGAVIFLFTFVFGVAEHFFIHQLSHFFHLADVYVSSTFACIMGMFFHPLKEKLTHWMKHFDHYSGNEHAENMASETLNVPNTSFVK